MSKEFDNFIKNKLESREIAFSQDCYQDFLVLQESQQIPKVYLRKGFTYGMAAGLFATLLTVGSLVTIFSDNPENKSEENLSQKELLDNKNSSNDNQLVVNTNEDKSLEGEEKIDLSLIDGINTTKSVKATKGDIQHQNTSAKSTNVFASNNENIFVNSSSTTQVSETSDLIPSGTISESEGTENASVVTALSNETIAEKSILTNTVLESLTDLPLKMRTNAPIFNNVVIAENPEVLGTNGLNKTVNVSAQLGVLSNSFETLGASLGAKITYPLKSSWSISAEPAVVYQKHNGVLNSIKDVSYTFFKEENEYFIQADNQVSAQLNLTLNKQFNKHTFGLGTTVLYTPYVSGVLSQDSTSPFTQTEKEVIGRGRIDNSLINNAIFGINAHYEYALDANKSIQLFINQYSNNSIEGFGKDMNIGVKFNYNIIK